MFNLIIKKTASGTHWHYVCKNKQLIKNLCNHSFRWSLAIFSSRLATFLVVLKPNNNLDWNFNSKRNKHRKYGAVSGKDNQSFPFLLTQTNRAQKRYLWPWRLLNFTVNTVNRTHLLFTVKKNMNLTDHTVTRLLQTW